MEKTLAKSQTESEQRPISQCFLEYKKWKVCSETTAHDSKTNKKEITFEYILDFLVIEALDTSSVVSEI